MNKIIWDLIQVHTVNAVLALFYGGNVHGEIAV